MHKNDKIRRDKKHETMSLLCGNFTCGNFKNVYGRTLYDFSQVDRVVLRDPEVEVTEPK